MNKSKILITLPLFLLLSAMNAGNIIIIGDSTAASYPSKRYPLYGWGQIMAEELKGKIKVINMARSGRSSKSYITEAHWDKVKKILQPGDLLLIQFGHNDEAKNKSKSSTVEEFKKNLKLYVLESKKQGAVPVLISPVCRRKFMNNKALDTHGEYGKAVAETAKELNVDFIDLTNISTAWLDKTGVEKSLEYYMHLAPGQYPGYPDGRKDDTHFNKKGAAIIYKIISDDLKRQKIYKL